MPTLTPKSEDNRIYECAILYPFPVSQKEEQEILKEVEKIFEEAGAIQMTKDQWGRRGLAYPIKGHTEGCFVIYHYEIDPLKVKEIEEALKITPGVLRNILIKPPKDYEVIRYSEKYEEWIKELKGADERRKAEEEEKLKRKITEKAKRQVQRAEEEKKAQPKEEAAPMEEDKLTEELEKLISDDELDI